MAKRKNPGTRKAVGAATPAGLAPIYALAEAPARMAPAELLGAVPLAENAEARPLTAAAQAALGQDGGTTGAGLLGVLRHLAVPVLAFVALVLWTPLAWWIALAVALALYMGLRWLSRRGGAA